MLNGRAESKRSPVRHSSFSSAHGRHAARRTAAPPLLAPSHPPSSVHHSAFIIHHFLSSPLLAPPRIPFIIQHSSFIIAVSIAATNTDTFDSSSFPSVRNPEQTSRPKGRTR